ncbi:MAG TPA: cytochrome C assembly protein, partial [Candidatus Dadabacteria bacterium]|nr:cytochrome C assembly protein [Candidatus Dadabacteria bacterium]
MFAFLSRISFTLLVILMTISIYMIFNYAPKEKIMGDVQRIFYFHMGSVLVFTLAFIANLVYSIKFLLDNNNEHSRIAYINAEVGVLFTLLTIVTGMFWAKPVWGVWWTWDAKLTTTLILWFVFVAYLMLRAYGPKGSQGARYCAIVALIGAIDAPIIYMATEWWRSAHPELNIGPLTESGGLDPRMYTTFLI